MSGCEDYSERIAFYDELSSEAQTELRRHLASCTDCRDAWTEVRGIMTGLAKLSRADHVDPELITRYGLYQSDPDGADYDGRRLADGEIAAVEAHLEVCQRCRERVDGVIRQYREVEAHLEEAGLPDLEMPGISRQADTGADVVPMFGGLRDLGRRILAMPRPALYPAAAVAMAAGVAFLWASPLLRGVEHRYYELGAPGHAYHAGAVRGDPASRLGEGLLALAEGRYETAIETLEEVASAGRDDLTRREAQLGAAVAYLNAATDDFLGRFPSVEPDLVAAAIDHLQSAGTSEVLWVREDAYWYLAKAHLLQRDRVSAREALRLVAELGGARASEAEALMAELGDLPD